MTGKRKGKQKLRRDNKRPKKGLTLPGYNNLGPFNELNTPLKKSDAAAAQHDIKYGIIGKRSYWTFNQADEDFLEEIKDETDYGARIAKKVFGAKKKLSEWNILPRDPLQSYPKENPFIEFHKGSGKVPLTRARSKALARQNESRQKKMTDHFQKKKNVMKELRERFNVRQPVSNLPQQQQAMPNNGESLAGGEGSRNSAGLKETQLDPVIDVERGFPNYQYASLPWAGINFCDAELFTGVDIGFRMTSPYDCIIGSVKKDRNTNVSGQSNDQEMKTDPNDLTVQSAQWFNWYAALYSYYSVVGCKWSILIENLSNEPVWVHQMYLNDKTPVYYATNEDMLTWPDCKSYYVEPLTKFVDENGVKSAQLNNGWQRETGSATSGANFLTGDGVNSGKRNTIQLSGHYAPGDKDHEIKQDSEIELWSETNQNPRLLERLFIRIKPETAAQRAEGDQGAVNYGRKLKYKYTVKLEYLVEFKQVKDELRWPTTYTSILPTITADGFVSEKQNEGK